MSVYLLLKTLHILSSTILFGLGAGSAYYALRAWRSGKVEVIAVTFKHLVFADWAFTATTAVFQPLSGLGLIHLAGWSIGQSWLMWSLGLYVLAGICWLPVVWLQIRVHRMAEQALRDGTPMPLKAATYMRWWFALGWPAFLAFMAIFYLMVAKPA
ncbi:DUF2269 domain-containing protein [Pseudomonas sp. TH05]|uniref:DUF2269 family protein n=1 Tax=unclassified Pseudomonas TaxID=196821 RepID=UPI0009987CC0|nr:MULTISPECIES: DUF2269 domain-containing protein [unclassified Pseudomonas]MBK5537787.1 DUF2269 domain-containing protein [Pseudomonas sp. TH07]MBK5559208.1 DUF2269 domain-containing protein [Pseudomonas sp. TH05]OOV97518.1 hypothetical protein MF4836_12530 [Pseudomonas sp. MF4836]